MFSQAKWFRVVAEDGLAISEGEDPSFADVARLLPPVLAGNLHAGDFSLDTQSFVGSRIASEKRAFSATGAGERGGAG